MSGQGRQVAVVGAGIAGLTAAIAFDSAGFAVDLFERTAKLQETGAGLQLPPNALRVLRRLSVAGRLEFSGVKADAVTLRAGRSGRIVASVPVVAADGTPYLSIRRADLQSALLAEAASRPGIRLFLDHDLSAVSPAPEGDVRLAFVHAGATKVLHRSPLVIAADGVRSRIASLIGHPAAVPSGDTAWRMTLRRPPSEDMTGIQAWLGPGRHAVAYPIAAGAAVNIVLISPEREVATEFGAAPEALRASLLRLFKAWDRRLLSMIADAGPIQGWPLLDGDRRPRPGDPAGILFIGDAAHAMRPYAAQGAAMAIEDAITAAAAFARQPDIPAAARDYEQRRRARLDRVRQRVAFHDTVYHLRFPLSLGRDIALRLRSKRALSRDLSWLYDWTPPEI